MRKTGFGAEETGFPHSTFPTPHWNFHQRKITTYGEDQMLNWAVVKTLFGHPSNGRVSFDNYELSNELSNTNPRSIGRSTIQLSNTNSRSGG